MGWWGVNCKLKRSFGIREKPLFCLSSLLRGNKHPLGQLIVFERRQKSGFWNHLGLFCLSCFVFNFDSYQVNLFGSMNISVSHFFPMRWSKVTWLLSKDIAEIIKYLISITILGSLPFYFSHIIVLFSLYRNLQYHCFVITGITWGT